jgi:hypothetical protein
MVVTAPVSVQAPGWCLADCLAQERPMNLLTIRNGVTIIHTSNACMQKATGYRYQDSFPVVHMCSQTMPYLLHRPLQHLLPNDLNPPGQFADFCDGSSSLDESSILQLCQRCIPIAQEKTCCLCHTHSAM